MKRIKAESVVSLQEQEEIKGKIENCDLMFISNKHPKAEEIKQFAVRSGVSIVEIINQANVIRG